MAPQGTRSARLVLPALPIRLRKEHYAANRKRYIDQARVQKQRLAVERTGYLIEYSGAHACVDCGETDPVVLEFDHLRDKHFAIGQKLAVRRWTLRAVLTLLTDLPEAGDEN